MLKRNGIERRKENDRRKTNTMLNPDVERRVFNRRKRIRKNNYNGRCVVIEIDY